MSQNLTQRIAILGGGPAGLFMYKRLLESGNTNVEIQIFERKSYLGAGMPYSMEGANSEHITNVSDNEIPVLFSSIEEWVKTAPEEVLNSFGIDPLNFNEYKVLPRLFFGKYLSAQFELLRQQAEKIGIRTIINLNSQVTDITDDPSQGLVHVFIADNALQPFNRVIICTGHNWPKKYEGKVSGYYDSPYPPKKLALQLNHPVGIKGSSLTAIDAIRTMARFNGEFKTDQSGKLSYVLNPENPKFRLVMHSRNGLLPAIRFHLEDSHLGKDVLISRQEMKHNIRHNGGFISLDYIFEKNFKQLFKEKAPAFYAKVKDMALEEFVETMMGMREEIEPFTLFRKEYVEAEQSIRREESIYWKEMLAILSYAMNYPAKYLSAEDMQRLQKVLMPLISIVIAFVPQSSCKELFALHDAGVLSIVAVGNESEVIPGETGGAVYVYKDETGNEMSIHFQTFVDCVGQPHLSFQDFPFKGLVNAGAVSPAMLQFQSEDAGRAELNSGNEMVIKDKNDKYQLIVPGITINDNFQIIDSNGQTNERIYIMAVPYIGGFNPDYSGIDFCEAASENIMKSLSGNEAPELV